MDKRRAVRWAVFLVLLVPVVYLALQLVPLLFRGYETQTAVEATLADAVPARGVAVRTEYPLDHSGGVLGDVYKRQELQQQIGEFNLARIDLNNEVSKQEKNAERITELNEKIQSIYTDVMNNESMQAYNEAKNEMDSLMQYINAILTTAVNGGDPMTVEEPSSCGGDCSGCSGCH